MSDAPRPMHAGGLPIRQRLWSALAGASTVNGILGPDVSEWQGNINWQQVGANRQFAFARATFGTSVVDPMFSTYRDGMRQYIKYRAYYHFLVADISAFAQANAFVSTVGSLQPGENVMLDWENYAPTGGAPSAAMASAFCAQVETDLGLPANSMLVYSAASMPAIGRPRVIASYGTSPSPAWAFWQYTDGNTNAQIGEPVPGIGACDQNVFAGSVDQLATYFNGDDDMTPAQAAQLTAIYEQGAGTVNQILADVEAMKPEVASAVAWMTGTGNGLNAKLDKLIALLTPPTPKDTP